jgi:DNA polymerase V
MSERPVPCDPSPLILPVAGDCVRAGFPSPAEDFQVERLDLTSILVSHPQATFFLRLRGDSMRDAGLFDGDLLVVNRALKPTHQDIVIAVVDGEFTCKTLWLKFGRMKLVAANPTYPEIVPKEGQTIEVWGVVTASIKRFRGAK